MAENSKIEWCHHTFNPWMGCTKVSEGCKNCYAETLMDTRYGKTKWGPNGLRVIKADSGWSEPLKWNRWAEQGVCHHCGGKGQTWKKKVERWIDCDHCSRTGKVEPYRARVFCASLADVFEAAYTMPEEALANVRAARVRLFDLIRTTPHLDWLLLTKRPENWRNVIEETLILCQGGNPDDKNYFADHDGSFPENDLADWLNDWAGDEPPANVWMGTSVEDQKAADERIPELLKVPAAVRFLSCEPLLGAIDFRTGSVGDLLRTPVLSSGPIKPRQITNLEGIDWVIVGGESSPNARPMHPDWARSLRDQCQAAGVAYFFKQWGEWVELPDFIAYADDPNDAVLRKIGCLTMQRVGKKNACRYLDGREWNEMPEVSHAR